uniref:Uncharacterized protein n=1 Tax=Graphocephala atropunctata TaxID=36148 RepID=A0A1B6M606_9HEMI
MIVICLIYSSIILLANTEGIENNVEELKKELEDKHQAAVNLKIDIDILERNISSEEAACNDTISQLRKIQNILLDKIKKNDQVLAALMIKINDEQLKHEEMEVKLKKIYQELELVGFVYEIIHQDAIVLLDRRKNGTALECQVVLNALDTDSADNIFNPRALSARPLKTTKKFRDIMVLKSQINLAKLEETKLQLKYTELAMQRDSDKQSCDLKVFDIKELISFTEFVLEHSHNTVETIKSDLEVSVVLSESLSLEIKFGETLLHTVTENIRKFRKLKESFEEDELCYDRIQNWSM